MENEKLKKVNFLYLIVYILCPLVILTAATILVGKFTDVSMAYTVVIFVLYLASIVWWIYGSQAILKNSAKKLAKELDASGFTRNMTFNGKSCHVVVDAVHGKMALIFAWNPGKHYVFPASRVTKAWVDDGRSGKGITEGSQRVSFLFTVDGTKVRVNTFTSNQRLRMNDNRILTGISKADSVVEAINAAKGNA